MWRGQRSRTVVIGVAFAAFVCRAAYAYLNDTLAAVVAVPAFDSIPPTGLLFSTALYVSVGFSHSHGAPLGVARPVALRLNPVPRHRRAPVSSAVCRGVRLDLFGAVAGFSPLSRVDLFRSGRKATAAIYSQLC